MKVGRRTVEESGGEAEGVGRGKVRGAKGELVWRVAEENECGRVGGKVAEGSGE